MANEPNINNLEEFIELQTGLVTTNLNPEAWVSRQSDTLGGLQSFETLSDLVIFHPNKMFLYMEANVGSNDKYRLITKPSLSDFPLSLTDTDANYFLNFWEIKTAPVDTQKRFNLFAGEFTLVGQTLQNTYFKIAQIANTITGTQANIKLSIQTDSRFTSGELNLNVTLNNDASVLGEDISYTENRISLSNGFNFFYKVNAGVFELWCNIIPTNFNAKVYYSIIQNGSTNSSWQFFENNNSSTTTTPNSLTPIIKKKYSTNVVDDIRISNNTLQQRKYNENGEIQAYTIKGTVLTSSSLGNSGNRYLNHTVNGISNLVDLRPIIDSRLLNSPNLNSLSVSNNTSNSTTPILSDRISKVVSINNTSSRERLAAVTFECVVQRDEGGNEEISLKARRSTSQTPNFTGTLFYDNRFIINADSLHQRTATFFAKIPANTEYYFTLYAQVDVGGLAKFFGGIKYSFAII